MRVQAPALDPFDALADSLPSAAPVAPQPAYTGPEVKEVSHSRVPALKAEWVSGSAVCVCVFVCL